MGWQNWDRGICRIDWSQRIKDRTDGTFELVERTIDDTHESKLKIRCVKCGSEKTIAASSIRGTNKIRCVVCDIKKTADKIDFERYQRRTLKVIEQNKKKKQMAFPVCERCGSIVSFGNKVCEKCKQETRRNRDRRKEHQRRLRVKGFDKSITLEGLFKRDNGICYLCGKACDWNDFSIRNGNFIVGKYYPTVEHVIALANGGTHTWDNVKLACFGCNTKKSYERKSPHELTA